MRTLATVRSYFIFPEYLDTICNEIILGTIDRPRVEQIIGEYKIDPRTAKLDFMNVILEVAWLPLYKSVLTQDDKQNVMDLYILFSIQTGEFYDALDEQAENLIIWHDTKV